MAGNTEFTAKDWLPEKSDIATRLDTSSRVSMTFWSDVWRRFKQNKLALFGIFIIAILVVLAIFGPMFSSISYSDQNREFALIPPTFDLHELEDERYVFITSSLNIFESTRKGKVLAAVPIVSEDLMARKRAFEIGGVDYIFDFSQKPYAILGAEGNSYPVTDKNVWNKTNPLGTDDLGRDLWIRIIYGARISLIVGLTASLVMLTVGVVYGGISAYIGGVVDDVMMRIVDIFRSIPRLLYVILLMVVFGSGLRTVVLTIGLVYWLGMARIVRGQVISLKSHEYVMAARVMGARTPRILLRHLIPNAMGPIIVTTAMNIPAAIFTEAFLSFVGLGVSAPQASWGTLANSALSGLMTYPYLLFYPAFAISLTVLAFNFVGDGLRDSIDPKLRQ